MREWESLETVEGDDGNERFGGGNNRSDELDGNSGSGGGVVKCEE